MKRILFSFLVFVIAIACQDAGPVPSPDSFCIFRREVSTNPGDLGKNHWTFLRCDPDPGYQIVNTRDNKGYSTTNCDCSKQP